MIARAKQVADELLTVDEVACRLKVHRTTVARLIKSGKLRATKVQCQYRIRVSWLDAYIDAGIDEPAGIPVAVAASRPAAGESVAEMMLREHGLSFAD